MPLGFKQNDPLSEPIYLYNAKLQSGLHLVARRSLQAQFHALASFCKVSSIPSPIVSIREVLMGHRADEAGNERTRTRCHLGRQLHSSIISVVVSSL